MRKGKLLSSYTERDTYKTTEILEADAIYAVYYNGKPFNIRHTSPRDYVAKYRKTSFANPGHAFNLAKKLNKQFKCTAFEVYKLDGGERYDTDAPIKV